MPRLVTSGDTTNNFGRLLPAVYIDQIYVSEGTNDTSDASALLNADLSIYISAKENTDITTLIDQIGDLRIFWFYVDTESFDWDLDDLINKKQNIWSVWYESLSSVGGSSGGLGDGTYAINMAYFSLSDIAYDSDGEPLYVIDYDDEGNRYLKFSYSSEEQETPFALVDSVLAAGEWADVSGDVYLFAMATFDLFNNDSDVDTEYWDGLAAYAAAGNEVDYKGRFGRFLTIETGDVAYETVWVNGDAAWADETIWAYEDHSVFDGTPIESITGQFYSTDKVTHSEIVTSFEGLLGLYEETAATDDSLQDMVDQVSYILETYSESAELLLQLNILRGAFPSKSSATNVGQLYLEYRDLIYSTNIVVETGTKIVREIIINTKVIDQRFSAPEWVLPTYYYWGLSTFTAGGGSTADDEITDRLDTGYGDQSYYSGGDRTYMSNVEMCRAHLVTTNARSSAAIDLYINYGFFFLDHDKLLYETANIGYFVHMDSIFNVLGKDLCNRYFSLEDVRYWRIKDYDDDDEQRYARLVTNFKYGATLDGTAWTDMGAQDDLGETSYAYINETTDDGDECWANSFLLLRNFELAQEEGLDDNRLMCFEFQEFEQLSLSDDSLTLADDWTIQTYANFTDNTNKLLYYLVKWYANQMEDFKEYYDVATDSANYTSDGRWTNGFIASQIGAYAEGEAPWILAPTYFVTLLDIADYSLFEADIDKITERAAKISAKINPSTGVVKQLEAFYEDFTSFYDDVLSIFDISSTPDSSKAVWLTAPMADEMYADYYEATGGYYPYDSDTTICDATAYATSGISAAEVEIYTKSDPTDGATDVATDTGAGSAFKASVWFGDFGPDSGNYLYINETKIVDGDDVSDYFTLSTTGPGGGGARTDADPTSTVAIDSDEAAMIVTIVSSDELDNNTEYIFESKFDGAWTVGYGFTEQTAEKTDFVAEDFSVTFTTELGEAGSR